MNEFLKKKALYNMILENNDECRIWKILDNGCAIGTLGYSKENVEILLKLLKSFEEQYGEEIDYAAAEEELRLYATRGKLFVYFDPNGEIVAMNGCVYDYDNATVKFTSLNINEQLKSLYFYGLSTAHHFRGNGACTALVNFAIEFAYFNEFDFVYARTDLVNSNSEWIMDHAGLKVCTFDGLIIAEWVDVTKDKGDYRLHMWLPLKDGLCCYPTEHAYYTLNDQKRRILPVDTVCQKLKRDLAGIGNN